MTVATAPARTITPEEQDTARRLLARARAAMQAVEAYDQPSVDRLCRAIATGNPADVREAERAFAPIAEGFAEAVAKMSPAPAAGARP